ncbi:hypothetical protein NDU88_001614 [Pleurodeles waltl]|uniref:Uncharacterized protein n=1 Tax=Pleurodeles waltl TaxID=8319 RepID=A0AAV7ML06_PLEWA|nr:hypothetical protein NDU88_001614 [Pleurodeles waltl]
MGPRSAAGLLQASSGGWGCPELPQAAAPLRLVWLREVCELREEEETARRSSGGLSPECEERPRHRPQRREEERAHQSHGQPHSLQGNSF